MLKGYGRKKVCRLIMAQVSAWSPALPTAKNYCFRLPTFLLATVQLYCQCLNFYRFLLFLSTVFCMSLLERADFYRSKGLLHPITVGSATIIIVFIYLRVASNRTLAPISIFSQLCIFILGSSISRILTQPELNFTRGIISIAVLMSLEYFSTVIAARYPQPFAKWFASPPLLLVFRGKVLDDVMRQNRVSPLGLKQAIRQGGYARASQLEAVVLEGNGVFSCIKRLEEGEVADTLEVLGSYRKLREEAENERMKGFHIHSRTGTSTPRTLVPLSPATKSPKETV